MLACDAEEPSSIPPFVNFLRKGRRCEAAIVRDGGVRKRAILHFLSLERRLHAVQGSTRTSNRERKGGREE